MSLHPVTLDDIREAQTALANVVVRTPLLENADVNAMLAGRVLLKAENFQRTGAFKIRGAYYRILNLTPDERACGVVSYSSGNHALGLAQAAAMLGTSAVIVMPSDVPAAKMAATRDLGAQIVTFDRDTENSTDVVAGIIRETGRIEVPPSAHGQVLAGAGTVALELLEDAPVLDAVLIPCGGGGLTASTAVVMAQGAPKTQVYAAEPDLFDDTRRSLISGKRIGNPVGLRTICDAIMTPIPNDVTFPINLDLLAGGVTASDKDVRTAMRFAFDHFKIVTEPGAVVGLAAILNGQVEIKSKTVATVITGGNIDAARFASLIGDSDDT
ncbi:MAG: threonine/serine dehydratase [Paracoccaceae bacterium]|nr:threonine/serine dehydratase [Paracoccaceae bacterium]